MNGPFLVKPPTASNNFVGKSGNLQVFDGFSMSKNSDFVASPGFAVLWAQFEM